ncbi:hypothetical protein K474DRAFT_1657217 [Panus rudis PR-1116 ss-1]|nr:hypothetical protein K474DRAFT_1657217 [Panus rudis PR-1116 ss-1]
MSTESQSQFKNILGDIPEKPSSAVAACLTWLSAITQGDMKTLDEVLDDNFVCTVLPLTIGVPVRKKQEWIKFIDGGFKKYYDFTFKVLQIVEGERHIVAHVTSDAKTITGGRYNNTYIFFWELTKPTQEGERPKLVVLKEFMDSLYATGFFASERERAEAAGMVALED